MSSPEVATQTCPLCHLPVDLCQGPLYDKVATPGHHMHFNRSGTCTLWPACDPAFGSKPSIKATGIGEPMLAKPPEGWRELRVNRAGPECKSIAVHYPGAHALVINNVYVVFWVRVSVVLEDREKRKAELEAEALRARPARRVGRIEAESVARKRSRCKECGADIVWTKGAAGQAYPVEPGNLQADEQPGWLKGVVHFDDCTKALGVRERRRRDRARQQDMERNGD